MRKSTISALAGAALLCVAGHAHGAFHLWRIMEVFTDSTGNVQFVEMFTTFSGQQFMSGHTLVSRNVGNTQTQTFTFTASTCTPTTNKRLLIATAGFGSLPGGVTPDFIIPANFLYKDGGTLEFGPGQQTITYGPLPIDGINSIIDSTYTTAPPYVFTPGPNTPTNCAGTQGSVNVPPPSCPGDINDDGSRNTADLTALLAQFGLNVTPGSGADLNGDGTVNTVDLTGLLAVFGAPCP